MEKQPMSFEISASGPKAMVIEAINEQVTHPQARTALHSIVTAAPGSFLSLTGNMSTDRDGTHGTLSMSGSFWTPTPTTK